MISRDFLENRINKKVLIGSNQVIDDYHEELVMNEKLNLLKDYEICPVVNNKGIVCIFGKDHFLNIFSDILRANCHVLKPYENERKDTEMIIFRNKKYTYVFDKLKERPVTIEYKTENAFPIKISIETHPITRYCSVMDNEDCYEVKEEMDILPILKEYPHSVRIETLLQRVCSSFQDSWNDIHKKTKIDYII